ncbi:MAG TPA: hypothetical protein VF897_16400 [Roseiflexaceae bacterium]
MRKEEMLRGARRPLAMLCLTLGVAGCILPIVPGLPFFVVAARLLGPRDPLLRRVNLLGRRGLRGLRASRRPLLRRAGRQLTPHWRRAARLMLGAR